MAAQMAEDMLRDDTVIETPQQVSSVTRGDTSISYRDKTSNAKQRGITCRTMRICSGAIVNRVSPGGRSHDES